MYDLISEEQPISLYVESEAAIFLDKFIQAGYEILHRLLRDLIVLGVKGIVLHGNDKKGNQISGRLERFICEIVICGWQTLFHGYFRHAALFMVMGSHIIRTSQEKNPPPCDGDVDFKTIYPWTLKRVEDPRT